MRNKKIPVVAEDDKDIGPKPVEVKDYSHILPIHPEDEKYGTLESISFIINTEEFNLRVLSDKLKTENLRRRLQRYTSKGANVVSNF